MFFNKKMFIFLPIFIFQILAQGKEDTFFGVLSDDFNQFANSQINLKQDELLFRSLCFICACVWASEVGGAKETINSYGLHLITFMTCAPIVALFYREYFNKNISVSRELFNALLSLGVRKSAYLQQHDDFVKKHFHVIYSTVK